MWLVSPFVLALMSGVYRVRPSRTIQIAVGRWELGVLSCFACSRLFFLFLTEERDEEKIEPFS